MRRDGQRSRGSTSSFKRTGLVRLYVFNPNSAIRERPLHGDPQLQLPIVEDDGAGITDQLSPPPGIIALRSPPAALIPAGIIEQLSPRDLKADDQQTDERQGLDHPPPVDGAGITEQQSPPAPHVHEHVNINNNMRMLHVLKEREDEALANVFAEQTRITRAQPGNKLPSPSPLLEEVLREPDRDRAPATEAKIRENADRYAKIVNDPGTNASEFRKAAELVESGPLSHADVEGLLCKIKKMRQTGEVFSTSPGGFFVGSLKRIVCQRGGSWPSWGSSAEGKR